MVTERETAGRRNKEVRARLGEFIQRGNHFMNACHDTAAAADPAAATAWADEVTKYLHENLDRSYGQRISTPIAALAAMDWTCNTPRYGRIVRMALTINTHLEEFSQQSSF